MDVDTLPETDNANLFADLQQWEKWAQAGDTEAAARIRDFLDDHPDICDELGDLCRFVVRGWLDQLAGSSPLTHEAMMRTVAKMRRDLLGESPSALETLLVGDIVATWLEVRCCEGIMANTESGSMAASSLRLKRVDSAQRRHQEAVKMLHEVRKLLPKSAANQSPLTKSGKEPVMMKKTVPAAKAEKPSQSATKISAASEPAPKPKPAKVKPKPAARTQPRLRIFTMEGDEIPYRAKRPAQSEQSPTKKKGAKAKPDAESGRPQLRIYRPDRESA